MVKKSSKLLMQKIILLVWSGILLLSACQNHDKVTNQIPDLDKADRVIQISNWQILGPFYRNLNDSLAIKSFQYDDLKNFNTHTGSIDMKKFKGIKDSSNLSLVGNLHNFSYQIQYDHLNFARVAPVFKSKHVGNIYAACIIKSNIPQEAAFMVSGKGDVKIWLNHKKILEKNNLNLRKYQGYTSGKLTEGNNLLLVKITKDNPKSDISYQARLKLDIASNAKACELYHEQNRNFYLKRSIIQEDDSLIINNPCFKGKLKLNIYSKKELIKEESCNFYKKLKYPFNLDSSGIYKIESIFRKDTFVQDIHYGNLKNTIQDFRKLSKTSDGYNDKTSMNISTQFKRLNYLLKNKSVHGPRVYRFEIQSSVDGIHWNTLYDGSGDSYSLSDGAISFKPTKARYIKIIGKGNTENDYNNLAEIEFCNGKKQISVDSASASSVFQENYVPGAFDKDLYTSWASDGKGEWIEFDLGGIEKLTSINLAWRKFYVNSKSIRLWEKRLVWSLREIDDIFYHLSNGNPAFQVPGTHIRSMFSSIDNSVQHYLCHYPRSVNSPVPLVIFLPGFMFSHQPFLTSHHINDMQLIDRLANLGEKHNFARIRPSSRIYGKEKLRPIGIENIFNTLEDFQQNYPIDTNKIYLIGVCSGASDALYLASKYPGKFAAFGTVAPVVEISSSPDPQYKIWHQSHAPKNYVENLYHIPSLFIHGRYDVHSDFQPVNSFVEKMKNKGMNPEFIVLPNTSIDLYEYQSYDDLYRFFDGKRRVTYPTSLRYSTATMKHSKAYWINISKFPLLTKASVSGFIKNNTIQLTTKNVHQYKIIPEKLPEDLREKNIMMIESGDTIFSGNPESNTLIFQSDSITNKNNKSHANYKKNSQIEGPIYDLFAGKFMLVYGTSGTFYQDSLMKNIKNQFISDWRKNFYRECLSKADYRLSEEDIRNNNLVLIGNPQTNNYINKIQDQLPIDYLRDGIEFRNDKYERGEQLCFIYPNPLNKSNYILVITAKSFDNFELIYDDPAQKGIYDYVVWKNNDENKNIINKGYFDKNWQ